MNAITEPSAAVDQVNPDQPSALALPSLLEAPAAEELLRQLSDRLMSGFPLILDGHLVDRIATPCVQVLVSAARTAKARRISFGLQGPSAALTDALVQLGLQNEFVS